MVFRKDPLLLVFLHLNPVLIEYNSPALALDRVFFCEQTQLPAIDKGW